RGMAVHPRGALPTGVRPGAFHAAVPPRTPRIPRPAGLPMPLLWTLPSNDLLLEKMRQDLPIVLPNAWRRPEAGRRGFGKPREGTREFHGNSELGFINVLPEIAILEMRRLQSVPRLGHRIAEHLRPMSWYE